MCYAVNMKSSACNVCSHQYRKLSSLESFKHPLPLSLRQVARNRCCSDAVCLKQALKTFRGSFCIAEYEITAIRFISENMEEQPVLFVFADMVYLLFYQLNGNLFGSHRKPLGHIHVLITQFKNTVRKCSGKKHGLPLVVRRHASEEEPDILYKTHIEEAVCLINYEKLSLFQTVNLLFQIVDQPAGCADEHIHPLCYLVALLLVIDPSKYRNDPEAR